MDTNAKPLPGKGFVIIFTTLYLLAQLSFFTITLISMPLIKDTIDMTTPTRAALMSFIGKYYIYGCIIAAAIELVAIIIVAYTFTNRRWPALITCVTMVANLVICILTFVGLYVIDLRNVYFTIQVTFLIPIISMFLTSVFIIDDTVDILSNKYDEHVTNLTKAAQEKIDDMDIKPLKRSAPERPARGNLRPAQNPNAELIRVPRAESSQVRSQDISSAAEKAIPNLK
ncbi:MAG: hypothetical protein IK036_01680 [Clostridia bacterium]|nr:hypothetical protein [Clostridia bacterium]MBR5991445.1 hypothetical protein [Clostridia bacterium]MBR6479216.1 hypothetical protein [Clostridia bacterium]